MAYTFMDLDFDCLEEIFKYLSPLDAFNTIGIFGSLIDEVAYKRISRIKEFMVEMRFPPEYPEDLLELIGKSIETFFITVGYSLPSSQALNILRPICKGATGRHLRKLTINYINFNEDFLQCILPLASQITHLNLCYCQLDNDFFSRISRNFTKVEHFNFTPGNLDLRIQPYNPAHSLPE